MTSETKRDGAFEFTGDWREFAPIAFTNLLLCIVTLGIYLFWARTRERRYLFHLPIVNAVTLPGGKIVIFDELIKKAASADEVAGVLAHEIGHVHHRDVMESLLRQLGLSVLLGGLDGNIGGYTNTLLSATYSRGAEERADGYAIDALGTAKVSPLPVAQFFRRLSGDDGKAGDGKVGDTAKMMNYFSSHPISSDRARRFATAAAGRKDYSQTLTPAQWASLRTICSSDPGKKDSGFRF